ncbi:hypothetical protein E6O75_ATG04524 [Venturia nashicola]|uniref:Uncharacterized protein n=1 Tax=Venturia nashicola TaxID=86259 RepID=A0A4Z1PDE3_9PEZI|nr:hypothetical protein E6O75_ATG04524 [Venturia nashicola]
MIKNQNSIMLKVINSKDQHNQCAGRSKERPRRSRQAPPIQVKYAVSADSKEPLQDISPPQSSRIFATSMRYNHTASSSSQHTNPTFTYPVPHHHNPRQRKRKRINTNASSKMGVPLLFPQFPGYSGNDQ